MTETNSNLIPVTKSTINNESVQTVNARELHQFLESKQDFSTWIKARIKQKSKKSEIINIETFYDSWAWKDLRYQALKKYGRRCMNCGQQPNKDNKVIINVDHIKPIRIYPELALDINNLQILCGDCNQGKGYWDETDFREISEFSVSEESLSLLHENAQYDIH